MTYEDAKSSIHVRSAMMIKGRPSTKFWKNSTAFQSIDNTVNEADKASLDWVEFDPREDSFEALA